MARRVERLPAIWQTRVWFLGQEDPLEKKMATHSSILAWRIPWTEEPGGLQSMGSQRVGHDWATDLICSDLMYIYGKIPRRRRWQPTPVFLPGESMDRGAWQAMYTGLQRVGHDWSDFAHTYTKTYTLFKKFLLNLSCLFPHSYVYSVLCTWHRSRNISVLVDKPVKG